MVLKRGARQERNDHMIVYSNYLEIKLGLREVERLRLQYDLKPKRI